jgi:hypothetical protein
MDDDETILKHLEMIQGVINRLSGNSSSAKTWTVGLVSATLLLHLASPTTTALLAAVPVLSLWLLDAMYVPKRGCFGACTTRFELEQCRRPQGDSP